MSNPHDDVEQEPSHEEHRALLHSIAEETGVPTFAVEWIWAGVGVLCEAEGGSHVTGRAVCAGLVRDLNEFYAGRIEQGLQKVGISSSEDVGHVVVLLVERKLLLASPTDARSDFDHLFRVDDLEGFLRMEGIIRQRPRWRRPSVLTGAVLIAATLSVIAAGTVRVLPIQVFVAALAMGIVGLMLCSNSPTKGRRF